MNITQMLLPSAMASALVALLLPSPTDLRFDSLELTANQEVRLALTSTQRVVACPGCDQPATRIQSRYVRTLADLPWSRWPIRLQLLVRRFCCANPACPRAIFTERLPQVAPPYARRTTRLGAELRQIGFALGGEAGARRSAQQGIAVSPDTLLRLVRRAPVPAIGTPRVVGIDDFALRKGHRYGTIVLDLERHAPIDLLPDRTADTVATWLRAHPGVENISRDRAGAYAEGATEGAPDAVQVADRWHLIQNLAETLIQVLEAHQEALQPPPADAPAAAPPGVPAPADPCLPAPPVGSNPPRPVSSPAPAAPDPPSPPVGAAPASLTRAAQRQQQRRAQRLARYEQVATLHQQGWSLSAIADRVGLHRDTVRRTVAAPAFPERQPRRAAASILDPYKPYLRERWQAGCQTGTVLLGEIQVRGYAGGSTIVFTYLAQVRQAAGLPPSRRTGGAADAGSDATVRPPTPRGLAWLILRRPETLEATEQAQVAQVRERHPVLETAIDLAQAFTRMVREREPASLDPWLEQASASGLEAFRNFATSLRRDYAAVKAGITLEWNNGPVEGAINRLKLLKRQMYGRAKLDLLRQRVLAP